MKNQYWLIVGLLCLIACQPTPRDIDFGSDMCAFCKMSVVDSKFAAEVVTQKGKIFVFDAIECMVPFIQKRNDQKYAHILVSTFDVPGSLVNAESSQFLISQNIPSPMGKFLSAYTSVEQASLSKKQKGGELYSWDELNNILKQ